jgi:hypothetical protein
MAFYRGPQVVTDGLVLALDAANPKSYPGSGTIWNDVSGNGNSGSLTNGPTFSNNSIVFDGVDDYVETVNGSSTVALTSQASAFCWFKTITSAAGNFIRQIGTTDNGFEIIITSTGKISGAAFLGGWQNFPPSNLSYNDNLWHNVVITINGTIVTIYVDSNSIYSSSLGSSNLNTGNGRVRIGLHPNGTANRYNGNIASVQLYNRALSSQEILQNYNAQKSRFNL